MRPLFSVYYFFRAFLAVFMHIFDCLIFLYGLAFGTYVKNWSMVLPFVVPVGKVIILYEVFQHKSFFFMYFSVFNTSK